MRIKYSPQKAEHDTIIKVIDENTVSIDGVEHGFDIESVAYPDIAQETQYAILEAHRDNGELYLTVLRQYTNSSREWDDGKVHHIEKVNDPGSDADGHYHEVTA